MMYYYWNREERRWWKQYGYRKTVESLHSYAVVPVRAPVSEGAD